MVSAHLEFQLKWSECLAELNFIEQIHAIFDGYCLLTIIGWPMLHNEFSTGVNFGIMQLTFCSPYFLLIAAPKNWLLDKLSGIFVSIISDFGELLLERERRLRRMDFK